MKFQVGDKVRFLNEAVEGIVSKILSNERVEITDGYGFTHTAPESALVKVEFIPPRNFQPEEKHNAKEERSDSELYIEKNVPATSINSELDEDDETIYAAITLLSESSPLTSEIELVLVNNTSFALAMTVSEKLDGISKGITAAVLGMKDEIQIGIYSQDELHQFLGFIFQFLFFRHDEFKPRPAAEKLLRFSSSDFIEKGKWQEVNNNKNRYLLIPLYTAGQQADLDLKKLIEKYQREQAEEEKRMNQLSKGKEKSIKQSEKYLVSGKEKVVDLHIEELLKDYSEMSNGEIISYQLNYFLYEMDKAMVNRLRKITFIHGVGEGILKSAIREELKKFPQIKYGDAPVEKFGYGATEVLLD
jgi:hypothetical protein